MAPPRRPLARFFARACLLVAFLFFPGTAGSQSRDRPEPDGPTPTATPPPPPPWQVSLALLGAYESNVDFRAAEVGDFGGSLRASLGRNWRGPRGQLHLSLTGTGVAYREERDADHVDGGASLTWNQRLSLKVGFTLAGYGAYESTTSQRILIDTGLVLPRTQSLSFGGSTGFEFKLGPRASLRLSGRYDRVSFDAVTLVGSQSASGGAALARRLGPRDEISLSYGFLRAKDAARDPLDSHYGALGWTWTLSRHLALSLAGGAGYNPETAGSIERRWYFYGAGSLQGQWRRATLLAQVRQSVTPAYGLGGSQISDTASLSATVPFGRRVQLSIAGNHNWGRFRSGAQPGYVSDEASLLLGVRLFRYSGLGMGYGYRRNDPDDPSPAIEGHRGFFGVTYSRP